MRWRSCAFRWIVDFFFVKQNTAYELRIRDWSADVSSSDLQQRADARQQPACEGAEADADVVGAVQAEHLQVAAAVSAELRARRDRVVHRLELRKLARIEQAVEDRKRARLNSSHSCAYSMPHSDRKKKHTKIFERTRN